MMDLFSPEMRRNPYPFYKQMRSSSAALYVPSLDLWMVFDYEGVKRVLSDPEVFSSGASPPGERGPPPEWLIFFDPPRHTKLRTIIMRAFTPKAVASLEPRIREMSRNLLDESIERGAMDLAADYSVPLAFMVIAEMIGIPLGDRPLYKRWSDLTLNLSDTVAGSPEAAGRAATG